MDEDDLDRLLIGIEDAAKAGKPVCFQVRGYGVELLPARPFEAPEASVEAS
ncbi:MAG: hypothetical protein QOJ19_3462 [Acidimicrobiia bacterium]|nr:hypothetical protein [Acidimicrobiia bacterium]